MVARNESNRQTKVISRRRNAVVSILVMSAVMISSVRVVAASTAAKAVAGEIHDFVYT